MNGTDRVLSLWQIQSLLTQVGRGATIPALHDRRAKSMWRKFAGYTPEVENPLFVEESSLPSDHAIHLHAMCSSECHTARRGIPHLDPFGV